MNEYEEGAFPGYGNALFNVTYISERFHEAELQVAETCGEIIIKAAWF